MGQLPLSPLCDPRPCLVLHPPVELEPQVEDPAPILLGEGPRQEEGGKKAISSSLKIREAQGSFLASKYRRIKPPPSHSLSVAGVVAEQVHVGVYGLHLRELLEVKDEVGLLSDRARR